MLSPIPHSLVPASVQQDVIKPRPQIPAVTPSADSAKESAVALGERKPPDTEALRREEQRRRQRRQGYSAEELATGEVAEEDVEALKQLPRQGLWIDIQA